MEYNSQREKLKISDYGRSVYKLIQYAKTIEDKAQRTKVAEAIVNVMSVVNPQSKENGDYRRKLWDHLMILSNWELDVDTPFEMSSPQEVEMKPHKLEYKDGNIRYRHYGKTLEAMIQRVADMPDGEEKKVLTEQIAHTMKRDFLTWNSNTVEDSLLLEQMGQLSEGRLHLDEEFHFEKEYAIEKAEPRQKGKGKKKKK